MKILVYEYFSGGGFTFEKFSHSILSEGFGMLRTLISDFLAVGHQITTIVDSRILKLNSLQIDANHIISISSLQDLKQTIIKLSGEVDAAYIIAPETDGILEDILKIIEYAGIISLNCSIGGIAKVSDKLLLNNFLREMDITTPKTIGFTTSENFVDIKEKIFKNLCLPIILKPSIGTSGEGVSIIRNEKNLKKAIQKINSQFKGKKAIAQEYIKGNSVSVSLLASGNKAISISLNKQIVTIERTENNSKYKGGFVPYKTPLKKKCFEISEKIIQSIPGLKGYVGIDLILTDNDVVTLEINPRLTTSYIGVRNVVKLNLAQKIIDCYFNKILPSEIPTYGYSYFSKIYMKSPCNNSYRKRRIPKEIIFAPLQLMEARNNCAFVSVKGKTKKETLKKFCEVKKEFLKYIKGEN